MNPGDQKLAGGILFTDQYELTMAQLYFMEGLHNREVQFDYFFRSYPDYGGHKAGYCINAGLEWLVDWMKDARFGDEEIDVMSTQKRSSGEPLFRHEFLDWLREEGNFDSISLRAIPEGRVVHAGVPLATISGPLAMVQILESSFLNHLNFQTLIATKAARIREAGEGKLLIEFGMRRGQGWGANAGARAALIGGADFTSNTGISHVLGYPPKGTHAHSMVQLFMGLDGSEEDAFRAYAENYPDDCLLLVDTVDTIESGIPGAIEVFKELKRRGHKPAGVRLDSGDLAYLSIQTARMLNQAGFPDCSIVLSNQLDEIAIWQIIKQIRDEASSFGVDAGKLIKRLVYGVGTRLITSAGNGALDGVYKMVSVRDRDGWKPLIKVSETPAKTLNPGRKMVWRLYGERGNAIADLVSLHDEDPREMKEIVLRHPFEPETRRVFDRNGITEIEPLLVDIIKDGKLVYQMPSIDDMREMRHQDISRLDRGVRRLINPHFYHVSLTQKLWDLKHELIQKWKGKD